ncbi:MAG: CDP-alcohol phosphatidyltransferase family protein [Methylibium sp.]|nr:CDP-alcohol phosphatidyltransferase family protein [Methylibium sp.]
MERRSVRSRSNRAIQALARRIARTAVTPNQISMCSVLAAGLVPLGLLLFGGNLGSVIALLGVQLRLLANVLDGLVAIEGSKASKLGALYNEFPDRIADSVILVAAGYVASTPALGWLGALLAALTAYVRVFGGALGLPQAFTGPMAKQHRMAVISAALVIGTIPSLTAYATGALKLSLVVVVLGSAWTCCTRTYAVGRLLNQAPSPP